MFHLRSFVRWCGSLSGSAVLALTLVAGGPAPALQTSDAQQGLPRADAAAATNSLRLAVGSPPEPPPGTPPPAAAPDPLDAPVELPIVDFIADPLDGATDDPPLGAGVAEQPYAVGGSERSRDAAGAPLVHDGDPASLEELDGERPTVVLDLGSVRPIAVVRWLQAEANPVVVQRSLLGGVWVTVDRVETPEPGAWQTIEVDWPARYLRLRFGQGPDDAAARLAEVEVYGPAEADDRENRRAERDDEPDRERPERRSRASDGPDPRDRRSERVRAAQERRERAAQRARDGAEEDPIGREEDAGGGDDGATEGRADVVSEDCGDGTGDCRIEIDVSAGTATCDESGGSGNRASGRNASAGEGGTCSKDASGGAVEIGDVDP